MPNKINKTVFVGMSGGVDSSVAAYLLKKQGYQVVGVFMRCYNIDGCAERDAEDARRVAEQLKIPFYVWDFEEEYKREVVKYMIDGYKKGITPNPDVMCNRQIKFGLFLQKARAAGADFVATGHYVQLRRSETRDKKQATGRNRAKASIPMSHVPCPMSLFCARDKNKDQSYFLWTLTRDQLKHCLFPIGDYLKPKVREIARRAGLPTADKKDSQGVCFLGKFSVADFLKEHIPARRGAILSTTGEKVGEHDGAQFYTIGQRRLGVQLKTQSLKLKSNAGNRQPFYVAEKNAKTNTLVVAEGEDNPALYKKEVVLTDVNFISPQYSNILKNVGILNGKGNEEVIEIPLFARVRYRQALAGAKLLKVKTRNSKSESWKLVFEKPVKFVALGQSAVFYTKTGLSSAKAPGSMEMLGGGVIKSAN